MKKLFFTILFLTLALVSFTPVAQAAEPQPPQDCTSGYVGGTLCNAIPKIVDMEVTDISSLITALFVWIATLIGTIALVMVIYSGAQMVFSRGEPAAVTKARTSMAYAIIGIVVILMAYVMVSGVQFFIGVDDLGNSADPESSFFINPLKNAQFLCTDTQNWTCQATFVTDMVINFLGLIGSIAMLYIVYNGFLYVTAGGNEQQTAKARAAIMWAVLGLTSVILSYFIVRSAVNFFA